MVCPLLKKTHMGGHEYFTLQELVASNKAKELGIDNTPSFEDVERLDILVEVFLDPLRKAWGKPIIVTSGYRCPKLNKAVGGSDTSVHKIGFAADLQTAGSFDDFRDFVVSWVETSNIGFDQILLEKDKKTGEKWIHVGLCSNNGSQRRQIKVMEK